MTFDELFQSAVEQYQAGDLHHAEQYCRELLKIQPDDADALHFLGLICYTSGNYDCAVKNMKKSLWLNPFNAEAHFNLGNVFKDRQEFHDAEDCYRTALRLDPCITSAYINLGYVLRETGCFDESIASFQNALQFDPSRAEIHFNLGVLFHEKGKNDKAIEYYENAIEIDPQFVDAFINVGIAYQDREQLAKAIFFYQKALELEPDQAEAHWNLSHALLLSGNLMDGWKEYEWRWNIKELYDSSLPQPPAFPQGSLDLSRISGLSIFLYAEQGFGDTIQFIRYAPLLAQYCAEVFLECPKALTSLLRNVAGLNKVIAYGEARLRFDVPFPLLSLPMVFNTTLDSIPARVPYISADGHFVKKWAEKMQPNKAVLKVGLVWSTERLPEKKSCSLEIIAPLLRLNDIAFYSLQKGTASKQAKVTPQGITLIDHTDEINDFSDTAALIENLDLVITIDTAVAHLSGALGKPVWTLLPFSPDWRWLLHREDSPWYPTMKLYRQSSPGDWEPVISRVAQQLSEVAKGYTPKTTIKNGAKG